MNEIYGKSILVRVSKGSSYQESTVYIYAYERLNKWAVYKWAVYNKYFTLIIYTNLSHNHKWLKL